MIIERGEGVRVYDDQGKEYIEGLAGLWSVAVGFGEQRLVKAAAEQMAKLPFYHSFSHKSHPAAVKLAERLVGAGAGHGESSLHLVGVGSQRPRRQDDLVLQQRARPARRRRRSCRARRPITASPSSPPASPGMPNFHRDFDLPLPFVRHFDLPQPLALRQAPARRRRISRPGSPRSWTRPLWRRGPTPSRPSSASR